MRFKDYTNETLNTLPYGLADQLITAYNKYISDFVHYGEAALDGLAHSYLGDISANEGNIIRALLYLNRKIEATRKTISFWDAYQIRDTIRDRDQALGQLAQLPANSSIVSNLRDPFVWVNNQGESETVYQGDILIKDYNERLHHIKTSSSGFYVPSIPSGGASNTFTINYTFNTVQQPVTPATISYTGGNPGYYKRGYIDAGDDPVMFPVITVHSDSDSGLLTPVVKYFTILDDDYEQVIIDINFVIQGGATTKIGISNPTPITLYYEVK